MMARQDLWPRLRAVSGQRAGSGPKPCRPEPQAVRIRSMIESLRRAGKIDRAAWHERRLAEQEGRDPAEWTRGPFPADILPARADLGPPLPKSQSVEYALTRARAAFWRRQGRDALADRWQAVIDAEA